MKKLHFLFIILLSFFSCNTEIPTQFSEEALNDTFITLDAESLAFKNILETHKGKIILIDVWATWCRDCLVGMPKVEALQSEYKDVVYMFLSLDRSESAWKKGIKKYNIKGEHYFMQSGWKGAFGDFLDLSWIPRYMLINKTGEIVVFDVIEANEEKLIQALKK